jgi:hypothetical protein
MYASAQEMPRSLGSLVGPTYMQILTKMLPSAKKMLQSCGLLEDRPGQKGHFTIGRTPPPYFKRPYNEPEKYEYTICFFNGAAVELISMDRPDQARGGSYDYKIYDEAVLMNKDFHDKIDILTLRGNLTYFAGKRRHGQRVYLSSQAHNPAGYWVEDQRWLKLPNGDIMLDSNAAPLADPEVACEVFSSYENVKVLGERTIEMWRKTLPSTTWAIEVMSERGKKLPNGFYPAFDSKIHTYYGSYKYDYDSQSEFGIQVKSQDAERDPNLPLIFTADFNAAINTALIAQESGKELKFMNEYFAPGSEDIEFWLKPFVDFYRDHINKVIFGYGDPGGNKFGMMDNRSAFDKIEEYLAKHGWKFHNMVKGRAYPPHMIKQQFIHDVLTHKDERIPRVSLHSGRCRNTIISIETAPILPDFQKDKAMERRQMDQRQATHPSDAFDYLIFYRYYKQPTATTTINRVRLGGSYL